MHVLTHFDPLTPAYAARRGLTLKTPLLSLLLLLSAQWPAFPQLALTGMTLFECGSDGARGGAGANAAWDTLGGGSTTANNLYLFTGPTNSPTFLTSGDTDASLNPNLTLAPGTYVLGFAATGSVTTNNYLGINLYFNGDTNNNRISAVVAATGATNFSVIGGGCATKGEGTNVPGADSLSYTAGGLTVTLSSLQIRRPSIDLVSPYSTSNDGKLDNVGFLSLAVSQVPPQDLSLPQQVQVLPIFFVPSDEPNPTALETTNFMHHLLLAQQRFLEMLTNRDTFTLATNQPMVINGRFTYSNYTNGPEGGAPMLSSEILSALHYSRFNCPYIFAIVMMDPEKMAEGGRTFNRGWNCGGGMLMASSYDLDSQTNFQSTLRHELGHAFGLNHVSVYGYNMTNNASIMSYTASQHSDGFTDSPTPGILIPEDLRVLVHNHRVFPKLQFNPALDTPTNYSMSANYAVLGAQTIPGNVDYALVAATSNGTDYCPALGPGGMLINHVEDDSVSGTSFACTNKWQCASTDGWVSADITFPLPVILDMIRVRSQYGGLYGMASKVTVQALTNGTYSTVASNSLQQTDQFVSFPTTAAST